MKIQKVKDYNREAIEKYHEAVKNWDYKKGGFPNLCFYTFSTPQGFHRKNGYVISESNSQHFRLTKKEVEEFITQNETPQMLKDARNLYYEHHIK